MLALNTNQPMHKHDTHLDHIIRVRDVVVNPWQRTDINFPLFTFFN